MDQKTPERARISLPSSVLDFGFSQSNSAPNSPSVMTFDFDEPFPNSNLPELSPKEADPPILRRMERHHLLSVRTGSLGDLNKIRSPLRSSFSRRSQFFHSSSTQEESDSEREREKDKGGVKSRALDRSSPSSDSDLQTPPLPLESDNITTRQLPTPVSASSSTQLAGSLNAELDGRPSRRLSHSVRPPRLLSLISESNPADSELKSEAQFQRMLASYNDMPIGRTKHIGAVSDRGRFPEEAGSGDDAAKREDTPPSEEDEIASMTAVGSYTAGSVLPANPTPVTLNLLEDAPMLESYRNSPSGSYSCMDVDMPPPASLTSSSSGSFNTPSQPSPAAWRDTPPPTSSVRPNKRKHDDRFDPYPNTAKRRAVSPSISSLRESLSHAMSNSPSSTSSPIAVPVPRSPLIRAALPSSLASSPGNGAYNINPNFSMSGLGLGMSMSRPMSTVSSPITSSPQPRSVALLGSPVLRPIHRLTNSSGNVDKMLEREQREMDGAGEGLGSLRLT